VILTEHGINAMPLEANPTVSPFPMIGNEMVNVKHMTEVTSSRPMIEEQSFH
jgi:hypothetical protein